MNWDPQGQLPTPKCQLHSVAASRTAAALGCGLHCPNKCAHDFAVHLRSNRIHVNSRCRQELSRVIHSINASWFNRDLAESRHPQFRAILVFIECTGDASDPEQHAFSNLIIDLTASDNI